MLLHHTRTYCLDFLFVVLWQDNVRNKGRSFVGLFFLDILEDEL